MSTAREAVENVRSRIFWGTIFLVVITVVWMGFISTANVRLKHTYEQPHNAPGNLLTESGGKDHMLFIGLYITPWIICILLLTTIAYPDNKLVVNLHFFLSMLIWIFFLICFIIWSLDWSRVNLQTAANAPNAFNDDRWCLVNFAIAPGYCANTVAPPSGTQNYLINQASLGVNGVMLTVYWMLFAFWVFTGIQLLYVRRRFISALEVFYSERGKEQPLLQTPTSPPAYQEEKTYAYEKTPFPEYQDEKTYAYEKNKLSMPTCMKKTRNARK